MAASDADNQGTQAWSTWRQALAVVVAPRSLRKSGLIAVVVGSTFFAMNQLGVIVSGHGTAMVWTKAALTYLTPLVVSNIGMLSATRRRLEPGHT
jgi:hypothetical protein